MLKITILCENTAGFPGLIGEHGFSALVELDAESILMDTGSGQGILPNTRTLRKDLSQVGKILISHGHYDHTEGFPQALVLTQGAEVYAHPDIFAHKIAIIGQGENQIQRFIGLPYRREYLESLGAEFRLERGFIEVAPDVFMTGEVPRETTFEAGDPRLFVQQDDEYVPDNFPDDQSLVINTSQGLIIVFGCAHAGMINTIWYARKKTGQDRVRALLGGTHLGFLSPDQLEESIQELHKISPETIAVSHCTGMKPAMRLMQEFGDSFVFANTGSVFQFD
ncbi:MAG: MBL fold metallo-hydrolase [Deltaproteobacteria bacterium]|nr:MBL fold metallo-hydrolase [Deltaproteobacteria bacterium]